MRVCVPWLCLIYVYNDDVCRRIARPPTANLPPHTHTQGRRCVLKDCCRIEDGAVLPPDTVVPPFTIFGGNPGAPRLPQRRMLRLRASSSLTRALLLL